MTPSLTGFSGCAMPTKYESLEKVLQGLNTIGDVEGSAIISRDGLIIASTLPANFDKETFSAMCATMVGAAETASLDINKGVPERVVVETRGMKLLAIGAGNEMLLVTITAPQSNLGLVVSEASKAASQITKVMGE